MQEGQVKPDAIEGAQAGCLVELAYETLKELVTRLVPFAEDPKVVRGALACRDILTANHRNIITRCVQSGGLDIKTQTLHVCFAPAPGGTALITFFSKDLQIQLV
jgi:hypothetical protein